MRVEYLLIGPTIGQHPIKYCDFLILLGIDWSNVVLPTVRPGGVGDC